MSAALSNAKGIDAPALAGDTAFATQPPTQNETERLSREIYRRGDKPIRVTGPCLAPSEGIATATADRPVVTAAGKRAPGSNNILKG